MTPDERQMLEDLATKVSQTPVPPLDKEAEEFIRTRIGSRPDALYLMTQTVLIQNLALEQARKQIQQLQQSPQAPATQSPGFLGGATTGRPSTSASQQTSYVPPPPTYQAVPVPGPSAPTPGGGAGSFLRGAAQTAAGVAAGALAFEGISSLFHGAGHLGGFGGPSYGSGLFGGGGIGGYGGAPEETIINNYYDSPADGRDDYAASGDDRADNQSDDLSQNDDPGQFDDTSDDDSVFGGDDGMGDDSLI
jgi:uncharacterized protein